MLFHCNRKWPSATRGWEKRATETVGQERKRHAENFLPGWVMNIMPVFTCIVPSFRATQGCCRRVKDATLCCSRGWRSRNGIDLQWKGLGFADLRRCYCPVIIFSYSVEAWFRHCTAVGWERPLAQLQPRKVLRYRTLSWTVFWPPRWSTLQGRGILDLQSCWTG